MNELATLLPPRPVKLFYQASPLTRGHLQTLAARRIPLELAEAESIHAVDHQVGAEVLGRSADKGSHYEGIVIPYLRSGNEHPVGYRIRRDEPDQRVDENGAIKFEAKYLSPPNTTPRVYSPRLNELHPDFDETWIVEGEFKALSIALYFHESGQSKRVFGLPGVSAWSGRIGSRDRCARPGKVAVRGMIPDLANLDWSNQPVVILFDANVHTNWRVRRERQKLSHQLTVRGANVRFVEIPDGLEGVNGIDDLLAIKGPEFVGVLFEQQLRIAQIQKIEFYANEQQDLPPLAVKVWEAMEEAESLQGRSLFWSGGIMSRVQPQGDRATIEEMTVDRMLYRLAILAKWYKEKEIIKSLEPAASGDQAPETLDKKKKVEKKKKTEKERYYTTPPVKLARHLLAAPQSDAPLPILKGIVTSPVFTAEGELLNEPGFHESSGLYYLEAFKVLPVPNAPTCEQALEALNFINSELLQDFPFAGSADRAHALALMILPFVREMIPGPTPLHLIEASVPGSGKSLLAHLLLLPALGEGGIGSSPQPEDDAEMTKLITAALVGGKGALFLDNLSRTLDSGQLANALTNLIWEGRILGISRVASAPVRLVFVATGNNPTLSTEITRRTIRTRLVPDTDTPENREDFKHPVIAEWATENRAQIVQAVHIIVRHWINQGKPKGKKTLGSYEQWSRTIGGILESVGVDSLLGNYREMREQADVQRVARGAFCDEWYERSLREPKKFKRAIASELFNIARDIEGLPISGQTEVGLIKSFGQYLSGCADVCPTHVEKSEEGKDVYSRKFRIQRAGTRKRAVLWEIELLDGPRDSQQESNG